MGSSDPSGNETKKELDRLGREGESTGELASPPVVPVGPDGDRVETWIEIWGRRVGRTLGWVVMALLLLQLLRSWGS